MPARRRATSQADDVANLANLGLFADLSRPELHEVNRLFDAEFFDKDQRVVRRGIGGSNFYVITAGEADLEREGSEAVRLTAGDYFGDAALLLNESPDYDVVVVTPLTCLVLPGAAFEDFLVTHPRVMYRMLQHEALHRRSTGEPS